MTTQRSPSTRPRFAVDTMLEPAGVGVWSSQSDVQAQMRVLTGRYTPASIQGRLDEGAIIFVPPTGIDSVAQRQIIA